MSSTEEFRDQLYNNLNMKETDELLDIWQTNYRYEWEDQTFDVLQDILQKRLGELPPQNKPVFEEDENDSDGDDDDDDEDRPVFYNPTEVRWMSIFLDLAAKVSVFVVAAKNLLELPSTPQGIIAKYIANSGWLPAGWSIVTVILVFNIALQGAIIYLPLKALGFILKILMEMEFNSRNQPVDKPQPGASDI